MRHTLALAAALCLCALCAQHSQAARASFRDDFADLSAWEAGFPTRSTPSLDPVQGQAHGIIWTVPPAQPVTYWLQRLLPITVDEGYEIRFWVSASVAMPLEVQLATTDTDQRLYRSLQLQEGWQQVAIPVADMSPFAAFGPAELGDKLFLRFWLDGSPSWAQSTLPRGTELRLQFAGLEVVSTLTGLPEDVDGLLRVNSAAPTRPVALNVYGHFLEHIYHSVEDGLYGELVRNRAFTPIADFTYDEGVL